MVAVRHETVEAFVDDLRANRRSMIDTVVRADIETLNASEEGTSPAVQRLLGALLENHVVATASLRDRTLELHQHCGEVRSSWDKPAEFTAEVHRALNDLRLACFELGLELRVCGQEMP